MILTDSEQESIRRLNEEISEIQKIKDQWSAEHRLSNYAEAEIYINSGYILDSLVQEKHQITLTAMRRIPAWKTIDELKKEIAEKKANK